MEGGVHVGGPESWQVSGKMQTDIHPSFRKRALNRKTLVRIPSCRTA